MLPLLPLGFALFHGCSPLTAHKEKKKKRMLLLLLLLAGFAPLLRLKKDYPHPEELYFSANKYEHKCSHD